MGVVRLRGGVLRIGVLSRAIAVLSLLLISFAFLPGTASAQDWSAPRTVFVSTTGHTSDGLFLDVWRSARDVLGDPVTEEFRPRAAFAGAGHADVVQYYEHLALIYLPDEEAGQQVQALDLGRQALDEAVAAGGSQALKRALERAVCSPSAGPCANIVATGHTLREPFLSYWQSGETASWLGLPLTEALTAPDGTRVQYFANGILRLTSADTVDPLPLGRIAAGRAKIAMEPIAQPADVPEYDEALFIPPEAPAPSEPAESSWSFGPGPQQGAYKEVVVSISAETMWAYEGGELMMSSLVSTGTAETPEVTTPV